MFAVSPDRSERLHFAEQGYLIVKGALTKEEVAKLEEASERIWHEHMANGLEPDQNLFLPNFIGQDQVFINLVDHPPTFSKVWALLNSWNIYLYHSHLGTTPQEGPVGTEMKKTTRLSPRQRSAQYRIRVFPPPNALTQNRLLAQRCIGGKPWQFLYRSRQPPRRQITSPHRRQPRCGNSSMY